MASNPRYRNGNARRKLRERVKSMGLPCALCGKPIDYSLPATHPMAYELDEIMPVSRGGNPLSLDNVQPTHRCCNRAKSNRTMQELAAGVKRVEMLPVTRDWTK